ncbi:hypothetical protein HQ587_04875 [bacterium]|nr:hypothetical protein [bacterium]
MQQSATVCIDYRCRPMHFASLTVTKCIIPITHRAVKTSRPDYYFIVELIESLRLGEESL